MPADKRNPETAERAEKALARPFSVLDAHLSGRPWAAGERFTVADINLASVIGWTQASRPLMDSHPALAEWLRRCLARDANQRVRQMARAGR